MAKIAQSMKKTTKSMKPRVSTAMKSTAMKATQSKSTAMHTTPRVSGKWKIPAIKAIIKGSPNNAATIVALVSAIVFQDE